MGSAFTRTFPYLRDTAQAQQRRYPHRGLMNSSLSSSAMTPEQKKSNLRLGLILASVAVVFFLGVVAKITFLNH